MKFLIKYLLILLIFFTSIDFVFAVYDPLTIPNNKFGIHISSQADISNAKDLVNTNGGEWGYVTFVIREDERNLQKWQAVFDELREAKLIPIVRIATRYENGNWIKPRVEDIEPWVDFLNQLNWVIKNRYVVIFNEPNQSKEWGGKINPEEYAQIYRLYHAQLKASSQDFFVLPAGLDVAPENTPQTMHPNDFWTKIYQKDPQIFSLYDGLVSHAYPHPDFSGSIMDTGRWSIRSFDWEAEELSLKGYDKNKPIFITETGWARSQINGQHKGVSDLVIQTSLDNAFKNLWNDKRIVAITPFILNYDQPPFEQFSWIDPQTKKPTKFYESVAKIKKDKGEPIQENQGILNKPFYPSTLQPKSQYLIALKFKNTGQVIWNSQNTQLNITSNDTALQINSEEVTKTKPNEESKIWIHINTPDKTGIYKISAELSSQNKIISEPFEFTIEVSPPNYVDKVKVWIQSILYKDFDQV